MDAGGYLRSASRVSPGNSGSNINSRARSRVERAGENNACANATRLAGVVTVTAAPALFLNVDVVVLQWWRCRRSCR